MNNSKNNKTIEFFLSTNTPQGFVSKFNELTPENPDFKTFILQGTPAGGKSTIMQKVADKLVSEGYSIEKIFCSNNPQSLDGVLCYEKGIAIADGTYPHVINPVYPQSTHQIISLYHSANANLLYSCRYAISDAKDNISRCNKYCQRFLSAAGQLMNDSFQLALEATDIQKVASLAKRIAGREFKVNKKRGVSGKEYVRFLSGITKDGILMHKNTPYNLAENIYLLEDEYGASSKLFLAAMRSYALEAGLDVYSCYCPLFPYSKIEHLFIPEISLGFMTTNKYHHLDINPYKVINSRRFTNLDDMRLRKKRITFNKKSATQLLDQSFMQLRELEEYHNDMESIYKSAIDYSIVDEVSEDLLNKI